MLFFVLIIHNKWQVGEGNLIGLKFYSMQLYKVQESISGSKNPIHILHEGTEF